MNEDYYKLLGIPREDPISAEEQYRFLNSYYNTKNSIAAANKKQQRFDGLSNNVGNILPGAISFAGQAINAGQYGQTADDILRDAGTTT